MKTSRVGRSLIKVFESFSATPYLCPAGVPTIGWGFTRYPNGKRVTMQDAPMNEAEAEPVLDILLAEREQAVEDCIDVPLTQGQFDALVSFAWNLGANALQGSTLRAKLNAGDYEGAADQFKRWNKSGGKVLAGLTRRRAEEAAMFRGEGAA